MYVKTISRSEAGKQSARPVRKDSVPQRMKYGYGFPGNSGDRVEYSPRSHRGGPRRRRPAPEMRGKFEWLRPLRAGGGAPILDHLFDVAPELTDCIHLFLQRAGQERRVGKRPVETIENSTRFRPSGCGRCCGCRQTEPFAFSFFPSCVDPLRRDTFHASASANLYPMPHTVRIRPSKALMTVNPSCLRL